MGRTRILKSGFFRSRSLARVSRDARLTFAGLWTEADDVGNGVADPRILKGALWPLDDDITHDVVEEHLRELADTSHIVFYEVDGERYYHVVSWEEHIAAAYRRGGPQFPTPEDSLHTVAREEVQAATEGVLHLKGSESKSCATAPVEREEDEAFELAWKIYPRKIHKTDALKAWRTRVKQGSDPDQMLKATENYAAQCRREEREARYVMHGSRFYGPSNPWEDYLEFTAPDAGNPHQSTVYRSLL